MTKLEKRSSLDNPVSSRREFMKKSLHGAEVIAIGVIAASFANGCSSSQTAAATTGPTITLIINDAANAALQTVGGTIALESNIIDPKGIFVVRESNSSVKAFSRECAHNGCTLRAFSGSSTTCPCHGSVYNTAGGRVAGPASTGLKQYTASISGNTITISM